MGLDENLPSALRWLEAKSGVPWVVLTARGFFQPLQLLHSDSGSLPQLHRESSSNRSESSNDMRSPSSIHSNMVPDHSGVCRCQLLAADESSSDGGRLHHETIHEVLHHTKETCRNQFVCGWKCRKLCPCKQAWRGGKQRKLGYEFLEGKFQFTHETRNSPVGLTSPKARKREELASVLCVFRDEEEPPIKDYMYSEDE